MPAGQRAAYAAVTRRLTWVLALTVLAAPRYCY